VNAANVTITVSNILGQQISSTNYGMMSAGNQELTINGQNLTTGIYLYTVTIGGDSVTKKMTVK